MRDDFKFSTSTATVAIFDPASLEHRYNDSDDWWTDPFEEIDEINAGNMMLVGLGQDGVYVVSVTDTLDVEEISVSAFIKCVSGKIFIGPGEELPAGGFAPFQRPYNLGVALDFLNGTYKVYVQKVGFRLKIKIISVESSRVNNLDHQLLLEN